MTKRNSNVAHFLRGLGILQTTAVAVARVPKYREKLKGNSSYGIYISIKKKRKKGEGNPYPRETSIVRNACKNDENPWTVTLYILDT